MAETWERVDYPRKISSQVESREVADLLGQYAAEMKGAASYRRQFQQARHAYERVASFN